MIQLKASVSTVTHQAMFWIVALLLINGRLECAARRRLCSVTRRARVFRWRPVISIGMGGLNNGGVHDQWREKQIRQRGGGMCLQN
ncbi:hypothetical protein C8R48DRAFT_696258, partial [Suillus tomentosus]